MANSVNQTGRVERQWDFAAIQRNQLNPENSYALWFGLSPTALLPAVWAINNNQTCVAYIWKLAFQTDTAIAWTVNNNQTNPAFTPLTAGLLGNTSVLPASTIMGQVAAAPALNGTIDGGFAAAGSYVDVILDQPLVLGTRHSLILFTAAVAANCGCAIWWSEYSN